MIGLLLTRLSLAWTLFNLLAQVEGQACDVIPCMTREEIHKGTISSYAWEIIGLGGRYGYLSKRFLSKWRLVDSDHFPPKSAYKWALHNDIKNIPETDMAAVTVSHSFHADFFTTTNNLESQCIMEDFFKAGDYYRAIDQNIRWYVSNPARTTGIERLGNLEYIKEGIEGGLQIHVKNGLITENESIELIKKHFLSFKMNQNRFLLTVPRRDAARSLIQCDTDRYTYVPNLTPQPDPKRSACVQLKKQKSKQSGTNSKKRTREPNQGTVPKTKKSHIVW